MEPKRFREFWQILKKLRLSKCWFVVSFFLKKSNSSLNWIINDRDPEDSEYEEEEEEDGADDDEEEDDENENEEGNDNDDVEDDENYEDYGEYDGEEDAVILRDIHWIA